MPFLSGFGVGILLCLTFGTVFFSLLQNSVDNGYRSGLKIAFGVVVCDALFISTALFGASYLPRVDGLEFWLTVAGVVFLTAIGLANLLRGTPRLAYPKTRFGNFIYYFTTGFLLNGLNPVNFFTWVTLAAFTRNSLHYNLTEQIQFMAASLLGIFGTQSALALSAHKLKRLFTPRVVLIFNRVTGVAFLIIAGQLAVTRLLGPYVGWW
jgi:L-lysine exporter family protein LysE/ArgO